jgi:hypothetical protein
MNLKVFITTGESRCNECGEELGRHAWITLVEEAALQRAEKECLDNAEARARRRERAAL